MVKSGINIRLKKKLFFLDRVHKPVSLNLIFKEFFIDDETNWSRFFDQK